MISLLPLALDVGLVRSLTAAQYPYALTIGTTGDVIGKVPAESIRITEAGPGAISTLSFTIIDVNSTVVIADNADVRMHDVVRDLPMFLGFIENTSVSPWAAQGRSIDVSCYGIEALLDTVIVPMLTSTPFDIAADGAAGLFDTPFIAQIGSYAPIRTGWVPFGVPSSLLNPVGTSGTGDGLNDTVVLDGKTLRSAIETWLASSLGEEGDVRSRHPTFLSVDFWGGLRYFPFGGGTSDGIALTDLPSDYAGLIVSTAGPLVGVSATSLSWKRDLSSGAIVNAVYVTGASPESTGWVTGDLSSGRHQATASTSGDTEESKLAAANGVMGQRQTPAGRGSLTLENYTPTNVHPGSLLLITDARMGWSSDTFLITQIEKTISNKASGTQDWTVTFFDPDEAPSAGPADVMRLIRTHTRGTLN